MKVIITGATGMVGHGVLLECIEDKRVKTILVLGRSTCGVKHKKVKEVLIPDFMKLDKVKTKLKGYNACFFCAGVSSAGMSEEKYSKLTYDLTLNVAKAIKNPKMTFCYVSGSGTNTNSRMMWARVKGRTEDALLKIFKKAYMFRPGFIQPMKGIKTKVKLYAALYVVLKWTYPLLRKIPNAATSSVNVGKAMIEVTVNGSKSKYLSNADINRIAEETKS